VIKSIAYLLMSEMNEIDVSYNYIIIEVFQLVYRRCTFLQSAPKHLTLEMALRSTYRYLVKIPRFLKVVNIGQNFV